MGCSNSKSAEAEAPGTKLAGVDAPSTKLAAVDAPGTKLAAVEAPANKPAVALQKKPVFPEGCKSLLCKYLTDDVWEKLKDVKDKHGFTLAELINSGVVNPNSSIGVYAGSPDTYVRYSEMKNY